MSARASSLPVRTRAKPSLRVARRRGRSLIKRTGSRRSAPLLIVAVIVVGAIVAGVLLEQVVLAQSAFKLQHINRRLAVAETRQEALLAEIAQLESPGRIERYARTNLGMVEPATVEYIVARVAMPSENRLARALETPTRPRPGPGSAAGIVP